MKIALLAYYFSPDQSIGAIRPGNWARWLSSDHEVSVITKPCIQDRDEVVGFKVLRPNSLSIRILDKLNSYRKGRRLRAQAQSVSSGHSRGKAVPPSGVFTYRFPCFFDLWVFAALRALKASRPDVVVATHSPYVALVAAWMYALFNPKVKLWVDFRDLWAGNHLAVGVWGFRWIERLLERLILKRADVITTVSEGLADYFRSKGHAGKVVVIHNAPMQEDLAAAVNKCGAEEDRSGPAVTLCYTGTIYPGWRDPSPLFSLVRDIGVASSDCSFAVASRNAGDLFSLADQYGVRDFIDFRGEVSRVEAMKIQSSSSVLVMLESGRPEAKGVLTGKVFEYLATDKPILVIGPAPDSELYRLIENHERLMTLEELKEVILGHKILRKCQAFDYSVISSRKVLDVAASLAE